MSVLKAALSNTGKRALFAQTVIVLPEAFNIVGEYYEPTKRIEPDASVEAGLKRLSDESRLCFIAGLVNCEGHFNEAVLIDADHRQVLSRKTANDGSVCYQRSSVIG